MAVGLLFPMRYTNNWWNLKHIRWHHKGSWICADMLLLTMIIKSFHGNREIFLKKAMQPCRISDRRCYCSLVLQPSSVSLTRGRRLDRIRARSPSSIWTTGEHHSNTYMIVFLLELQDLVHSIWSHWIPSWTFSWQSRQNAVRSDYLAFEQACFGMCTYTSIKLFGGSQWRIFVI